jgi:hypothetical protein
MRDTARAGFVDVDPDPEMLIRELTGGVDCADHIGESDQAAVGTDEGGAHGCSASFV